MHRDQEQEWQAAYEACPCCEQGGASAALPAASLPSAGVLLRTCQRYPLPTGLLQSDQLSERSVKQFVALLVGRIYSHNKLTR